MKDRDTALRFLEQRARNYVQKINKIDEQIQNGCTSGQEAELKIESMKLCARHNEIQFISNQLGKTLPTIKYPTYANQ